jgi:hypothetical protein
MREPKKPGKKVSKKKRNDLDDEYTVLAIDQTRRVLSTHFRPSSARKSASSWTTPRISRRTQCRNSLKDDLRDATLSALDRIEVPDIFTYLCPWV